MVLRRLWCLLWLVTCNVAVAQQASILSPEVKQFVKVDSPVVALTHVRVIDGTGAAARNDQTIILADGKIQQMGDAATTSAPSTARVLDLSGYTVIPGLVMMHEHLYYTAGFSETPDGKVAAPGPLINQQGEGGPLAWQQVRP